MADPDVLLRSFVVALHDGTTLAWSLAHGRGTLERSWFGAKSDADAMMSILAIVDRHAYASLDDDTDCDQRNCSVCVAAVRRVAPVMTLEMALRAVRGAT